MASMAANEFDFDVDGGTHDVLTVVKASVGGKAVALGSKGHCRFCGSKNPKLFRTEAHSVPEGLGNKWIVSLDECDSCNATFSKYEDALAKTIGPILTIGGTQGKGNAVRQTGRSHGPAIIKHQKTAEGGRHISMEVVGEFSDHISVDPAEGTISIRVPVATERFIPRFAYKSLAKMGISILPQEELLNFKNLIAWVRNPDDETAMPPLSVGISFASIGNAPRLVAAALLRRRDGVQNTPYMVFVVSVGSACFQIDLKSDALDGYWPPTHQVRSAIRWTNAIGAPGKPSIRLEYGTPFQLDWSSAELQLQPIEAVVTTMNPRTGSGSIAFLFRDGVVT